ncbi:hypothetical protein KPL78_01800 [Roseomonas sp. HJA6]|uniref:Uncharacterized protein n=1 Tax=Roseomonas alba TaxID=2846776 RepID=A0ABS7A2M0_9PROT|nr:hypothetical protein [Neoroseomonas alba]MBW6396556.1 hypothetical protein [Neoroseomonas alba]
MGDISVGAVGAAAIAGFASLLGLIIAKEQKVSEFRQAWIDALRKCFVDYLVNINAVSDNIRLRSAGVHDDKDGLLEGYRALNEASNGIKLRINNKEKTASKLLKTMGDFEGLASDNKKMTPENIKLIEDRFLDESQELLKFEWKRVKRGEHIFVLMKYIAILIIFLSVPATIYLIKFQDREMEMQSISHSNMIRVEGFSPRY